MFAVHLALKGIDKWAVPMYRRHIATEVAHQEEDIMLAPKVIHLRLERDLVKRLDQLTVDYDLFRTDVIEMLLEEAVDMVEEGELNLEEQIENFFEKEEEEEE